MDFSTVMKNKKWLVYFSMLLCCLFKYSISPGQTYFKGFGDVTTGFENNKVSFGLGEQDLFITSEISNRLSFLGETVFKLDSLSHSGFDVSIERFLVKYGIIGNNSVVIGKLHSPLNYWNDNYHHGRIFFPTIYRPLLFESEIIPLHTTGINLQGHDLGNLKFGYDLMIGNGLGSSDVKDNDRYKSFTAALHIKPFQKFRIGASYYKDVISKGAKMHEGRIITQQVKQRLYSGSVSYFGNKFEFLAEGSWANNTTDSTGKKKSLAYYFYAGFRITEKLTAYTRVDAVHSEEGELFYEKNNTSSFLAGIRFKLNYLAVLKMEYQHEDREMEGVRNSITAQVAVRF